MHERQSKRNTRAIVRSFLMTFAVLVAGCSSHNSSLESSSNSAEYADPLENPLLAKCAVTGVWKLSEGRYVRSGGDECIELADQVFENLSEHRKYSTLKGEATQIEKAKTFQTQSGLLGSGAIDAETFMAMKEELLLAREPVSSCAKNPEVASWSRQQLVEHLSQMDAFSVSYGPNTAARSDLLDPAKSTPPLVGELSRLTYFSECNGINFNVLMVNTGHSVTTVSGNTSQHVVGQAVDIRPMNNSVPMPAWGGGLNEAVSDEQYITNNPQAYKSAQHIINFLTESPERYNQVIWSESTTAIDHGEVYKNYYWGDAVTKSHHDHIHIAVAR